MTLLDINSVNTSGSAMYYGVTLTSWNLFWKHNVRNRKLYFGVQYIVSMCVVDAQVVDRLLTPPYSKYSKRSSA